MNTRDVSETIQDWQKRAGDSARNICEATDRYVHDNTWSAVALAAVLGCVVGYLLANPRD